MRVTADAKIVTRGRILEASQDLFARVGFDAATTREIATAAKIGAGTLFNYFPTKEAIAVALAAEAMAQAHGDFEAHRPGESLAEEPLCADSGRASPFETGSSLAQGGARGGIGPTVQAGSSPEGESIRLGHLAVAEGLIAQRHPSAVSSPVAMSLYWTLYTGVLAFSSGRASNSPGQEDTLAVIDHYLKAFAGSLAGKG